MAKQVWRSHWDSVNKSFFEQYIQSYKIKRGYSRLLQAVPEIDTNGCTLEVGAGKAWQSQILRSRGCHTTAIDYDPATVEANAHSVDRYVCGDMYNLPFPNNSFDLVLSCGLIEHCTDIQLQLAIAEMARVGRRVVAWFPSCTLSWKLLWKIRNSLGANIYEKTYHRQTDIVVNFFKQSELEQIRSGEVNFAGIFPYLFVVGNSKKGRRCE